MPHHPWANVRLCNRKSSLLAREAPEDGMIQNSKIFQPHSLDSIPHIVVRISILLPTYVDVVGVYAIASVHDMCLCLHFANEMVFATRQTILMIIIPSSSIKSSLAHERHPWSMWLPLPMTRAVWARRARHWQVLHFIYVRILNLNFRRAWLMMMKWVAAMLTSSLLVLHPILPHFMWQIAAAAVAAVIGIYN